MIAPRTLRRACLLLAAIAPLGLQAQDAPEGGGYRVVASTLDGGTPQTSSEAVTGHVLRGTVGQPDAAVSGAGSYRLEGGFWPADKAARGAAIFADGFETP